MFRTAIKLITDPERYRGLPEKEQQRLLEKKLLTLDARGIRPTFTHAPGSPQGQPLWAALAFLDELLSKSGSDCNF